jgi:Sulfatase
VGHFVDRLQETGMWDEALVVVVGDHGASFIPGEGRRMLTDGNAHEILWSTLFLRAPDLDPGPSDVNMQAVDLLPTMADLLDVDLPWAVEGGSILDRHEDAGQDKTYYRFVALFDPGPEEVVTIDGAAGFEDLLEGERPAFDADDPVGEFYRSAPLGELYERSVHGLPVGEALDATAAVDALDDLLEGRDDRLPSSFRGVLDDDSVRDDAWVVLAVDGVVGGFSPLYREEDGDRGFALLLDQDRVRADGNTIEVFVTDGPGQPLHPIAVTARS